MDLEHTELHRTRYWRWEFTQVDKCLDDISLIDYVVLLPKTDVDGDTVVLSEFTMVTKEWLPAMLEHFELANTGMEVKVRMGGQMI
jgi:hypothetical protein